jgi:hypothetical protein
MTSKLEDRLRSTIVKINAGYSSPCWEWIGSRNGAGYANIYTSDRPRITIWIIEGCCGKVDAKGLCTKHCQRARRHGGDTSDRPREDHG